MSTTNDPTPSFDDPLADERLRFFLEHRALIEQWAALGKEVRAAVCETLEGLTPEVEALALTLGDDVSSGFYETDRQWPRIALVRQAWPQEIDEPAVAVAFEWWTRGVNPADGNAPYVGIRVRDPAGGGKAYMDALKPIAKQRFDGYKVSASWPAFKQLLAREGLDWWRDVPAWRAEMLDGFRAAWQELSPAIDEVVSTRLQAMPEV